MELLRSNFWEIKKSPSLTILGGLLALAHLLQFFYWMQHGQLPLRYMQESAPMCWPMFESCEWVRALPMGLMRALIYAYAVFAAVAAGFFFFTRFAVAGFVMLLLAFIPGLFLYVQDFRLSSNPGYALYLFSFLFLFIPDKVRLFRFFFVSFFVASGLMKLSPEWLTGDWFLGRWHLPAKLAEWFAALSALIELIATTALLFKDGRYFWTGWATLFVYLAASWWATNYYGPGLFIGLLIFLAVSDLEARKTERDHLYQSFIRPEPTRFWSNSLIAVFWLAMAAQNLHFPGQNMLSPLSRLLVPNQEAVSDQCEQSTYAIFKNRVEVIEAPVVVGRPLSMQCHPYLRFLDLKAMCQSYSQKPEFQTIASYLRTKHLRDRQYKSVFSIEDFCSGTVSFKEIGQDNGI